MRRFILRAMAAAFSLCLAAASSRADDYESDLLAKYQKQNRTGADKRQDRLPSYPESASKKPAPAPPASLAATPSQPAVAPVSGADAKLRVGPWVRVTTGAGTVLVPDGGTAVQRSFSTVDDGRNEGGVPILGKVPYLGRGFRNVGHGRFLGTVQSSVSVRIIRLADEDARLLGKE